MKKSVVLNTYLKAVVALTMTFAVACTGPGQSPTLGAQGKTADPGQQNADGTTDGNGGNGVNGKIYESYIVDPQNLPAYKNILETKIANMEKIWADASVKLYPTSKPDATFNLIWKMKKWYIAPVSLQSLNKKTIGVEFTNENTEQLALQTDSEIWIDSRLFEKMSPEDQARLLLHEYVMTMYLFKFQKLNDLCITARTVSSQPEEYHCSDRANAEELFPFEPKRDLDKADYTHIRSLTSSLMNTQQFTSQKVLANLFLSQGFDKRTFRIYEGSETPMELTAEEMMSALKKAIYSQKFNGDCQGVQSGTVRSCALTLKESVGEYGVTDLEVGLVDANSKQVLRTVKFHFHVVVSTELFLE
jgi:hypothetical protein